MKLVEEGFDIYRVKDKLFFFDQTSKKYVALTQEIYRNIQDETIKF